MDRKLNTRESAAVGMAISRLERYAAAGARGLKIVNYDDRELKEAQSEFYRLATFGADQNAVANEAMRIVEAGKGQPYTNPAFRQLLVQMIDEAYTEVARLAQGERRADLIDLQIKIAGDELLCLARAEASGVLDEWGRGCSRSAVVGATRMLAKYGLEGHAAVNRIEAYIYGEAERGNSAPVKKELIEELIAEGSEWHSEVRADNLRGFPRPAKAV